MNIKTIDKIYTYHEDRCIVYCRFDLEGNEVTAERAALHLCAIARNYYYRIGLIVDHDMAQGVYNEISSLVQMFYPNSDEFWAKLPITHVLQPTDDDPTKKIVTMFDHYNCQVVYVISRKVDSLVTTKVDEMIQSEPIKAIYVIQPCSEK